jgi:hypothetical protein
MHTLLPNRLKIGPTHYSVGQFYDMRTERNEALYGEVNHDEQLIRIRAEQRHEQAFVTLLHECLHVIDNQYQIGLTEKMIHRLAPVLTSLLVDNPALCQAATAEYIEP